MKDITISIKLPNGHMNQIGMELTNLQYYLTETGDFKSYIPSCLKRLEMMGVEVDSDTDI